MAKRAKPKPYIEEDPSIEWLAWMMDNSIRVGPWRVGMDGFLGLIPGIGDLASAMISTVIIMRAMQSGISKAAVMRMVINVALDSLAGSIPIFGDVFDFAYKSNTYNLQIYREALQGEREPLRDWSFVLMISIILLAIVLIPIISLIYVTRFLISYV